jgi:hypothetical protein
MTRTATATLLFGLIVYSKANPKIVNEILRKLLG